jgi:ABC-type antimicrobial peptide transport system permease subunit
MREDGPGGRSESEERDWKAAVRERLAGLAIEPVQRRSIADEVAQHLEDLLSDSLGSRRFNMYLLGCFAGVALLLACIGLFGVLAYLVAQRTRDIGIRMALGARRADVFRLVVGHGMLMTAIGALLGIGGGIAAGRVLRRLLFSVTPTDLTTFVAVPAVLLLVALAACAVPARRAMRVDPLTALRAE